ncbi:MAG: isocitrate dehydrogenase, partial [Pseudomonadota bacterium]
TQVWPSGSLLTDCVNQYRVRVETSDGAATTNQEALALAVKVSEKIRVCSTEMLMRYNDIPAYSLAQGQ